MALTNDEKLAIKAKLVSGVYGLTTAAEDDGVNADIFNTPRPEIQVDKTWVSLSEINFDRDEYAGLSPADQAWLDLITRSGSLQPANVRAGLNAAFGPSTNTRASYTAAFLQDGSLTQQMYGQGVISQTYISPGDIAQARVAT